MSKWKKVRLGDVAIINPSKPKELSQLGNSTISFIPMTLVSEDGDIYTGNSRPMNEVNKGFSYFIEGDVLFAKITPCMENGKCAIARDLVNGIGFGSTEFHVLRPNFGSLTSEWIFWFLRNKNTRILAEKNMTGSAGQKRVPKLFLEKVQIPLPPLDIQKQIAHELDTLFELLALRKRQLEELDQLIRSVFYEMFGDPVSNEKGWDKVYLSKFYYDDKNAVKCGPFGSALKKGEYTDKGIPVWTMDNISKNGEFIPNPFLYISEEKYNKLKNYDVINNDIIISRAGTVGKMCVVSTNYEKSIISTNLIRLRLNEKLLPIFVVKLLTICGSRVSRLKTGADDSFTHMNTKVLDSIEFPYPPLELQLKFQNIVSEIEKQKALIIKSLDETQLLFDSLMSKYFDD